MPRSLIKNRLKHMGVTLIIPALIASLWYFEGVSELLSGGIIPAPQRTFGSFWTWIFGKGASFIDPYAGTWTSSVLASLQRVVLGFSSATIIATTMGLFIGWSSIIRSLIDPSIQSIRPIPIPAWVPFVLITFGVRPQAAVALIFLSAFFPIVVNTTSGVQSIPVSYVHAARMLGASTRYILRRVVLPAALPSIFVGMRVGVGISWMAVIIAEMVGVRSGLGYVLWEAYYWSRMDIILCAMMSLAIMGFLSDRIIYYISLRTCYWATKMV